MRDSIEVIKIRTMTPKRFYINKCNCGWNFISKHHNNFICPICKTNAKENNSKLCICCGKPIIDNGRKYCKKCKRISKLTYDRAFKKYGSKGDIVITSQYGSENYVDYSKYCDGNCMNCKYESCILPVDDDDTQGELF